MTDHELATKLKELADVPAPPVRIDVELARRAGRRRRRLRTVAMVAGCAVVVAGGVVSAVSVFGPAEPAKLPGPAAATHPPEPAPTDDPLVAKAVFGWLPDTITGVEYGVGEHGDYTLGIGRGDTTRPMIWLAIYDREPPLDRRHDMGGKAVSVPTRVGDRDGYWVTTDPADPLNHGYTYLRWPTADGRWAELLAYYLDIPDLSQTLLRVAANVTVENRAVPLPLRITGLPANFRIADGGLWRRPEQDGVPWRVVLAYSVNGASVTITVSPPGGKADGIGEPVCTTKNGLTACVKVDRPTAAGVDAIGGAQGLLDRITLLGPDERAWTTHVG